MQLGEKEQAVKQARQEIAAEVDELQQLYDDLQTQRQAQGYHLTHQKLQIRQQPASNRMVRAWYPKRLQKVAEVMLRS